MDVQQLIADPTTSGSWSLRGQDPEGVGPVQGQAPWWERDGAVVPEPPAAAPPRTATRAVLLVGTVAALLVSAVAAGALLAGFRWFVVETPSMGTAAAVGSLVITRPAPAQLHRGDVIAFVPPGTPRVYTHRVFAVAADGGITTKGDINGAPDGWVIQRDKVLGEAVAVVPGGGYLVRGLPVFLVGAVVVWAATLLVRRRDRRASARVLGLHLVGTLVVLWLHPFVQVVLLATENIAGGIRESIVSTGLLPIKIVDSAGTVLARLTIGRPEVLSVPASTGAADRLTVMPDLGPMLQLLLVAIAFVPAVVVMIIGLPREPGVTA